MLAIDVTDAQYYMQSVIFESILSQPFLGSGLFSHLQSIAKWKRKKFADPGMVTIVTTCDKIRHQLTLNSEISPIVFPYLFKLTIFEFSLYDFSLVWESRDYWKISKNGKILWSFYYASKMMPTAEFWVRRRVLEPRYRILKSWDFRPGQLPFKMIFFKKFCFHRENH